MPLIDTSDPLLRGGSGGISYKFVQIGQTVTGTIVDAKKNQQTDFTTKEPKTYKNGDPMMQIVVTLQTNERDPMVADDSGLRNVYIKSGQPTAALGEAITASGAPGLDVGGTLVMQHTHLIPSNAGNPMKGFAFAYTPPAAVPLGQITPQVVSQPTVAQPQAPIVQQPNYGQLSTPAGVPQVQQPVYQQPLPQGGLVAPAFQQPVQPQIPGIGQLMGQPQPVVQQPVAPVAPAGGVQRTPEQQAVIDALPPEQRALLGL